MEKPLKGDASLPAKNPPENQLTIDEQEKEEETFLRLKDEFHKKIAESLFEEDKQRRESVAKFTTIIKARLQEEQKSVDEAQKANSEYITQYTNLRKKELADLQSAITQRIKAEQIQLVKSKETQISQDLAGVKQNEIFGKENADAQRKQIAEATRQTTQEQERLTAAVKDYYSFEAAQGKALLKQKEDQINQELREIQQKEILTKAVEDLIKQEQRFSQLQTTNPVAADAAAAKGFTPDKKGFKVSSTEEEFNGIKKTTFQYEALDGQIKKLTITQDRYNKILDDTQKRFRTLGSAIVRDITEVFKWSIAVAVVYGPLQKLQQLVTTMIANEAELANIAVALGQSHKDLGNIFNTAAKAAIATGEFIDGVLQGYTLAYRAAGRYTDQQVRATVATKLLQDSLLLSKLSALDQAQALDTLVGALQQLGLNLTQGSDLINKWVAVSKAANVGVETLAESFAITATSADSAGISMDELNGIIAVVAENTTLSATESGNAVRGFIAGFQTDSAQKALRDLGVATETTGGQARDFVSIMKELSSLSATGLISKQQLSAVASAIGGGARRGPQVEAIIKNLGRAGDLAKVSAEATTEAYDALGEKLDTVQTSITNLGNAFQILAQNLGSEGGLLSIFQSVVGLATDAVDALTRVVQTMGKATPVILGGLGALAFAQSNPARIAQFLGANSAIYSKSGLEQRYGKTGGSIGPETKLASSIDRFGSVALGLTLATSTISRTI